MEALYHYVWQYKMLGNRFTATDGTEVEVVHPGLHNSDAGPDFFNARIKYAGREWAGNVEIHVKASDWKRHGHHTDPAYDTVILHVVGVNDAAVERSDGSPIPQITLSPSPEFFRRYLSLTDDMDLPGCLRYLESIPEINKTDWLCTLGMERLHEKAEYMKQLLQLNGGDWEQTLFILLARALGFGLNGVPFELVAKSLPLNYIRRHRDNPEQIEALLFGQAGMLDPRLYPYDSHYTLLCREYEFLSHKYGLKGIDSSLWKYARTRPGNFPERRLAILASMLASGIRLHGALTDAAGNYDLISEIFKAEASAYWKEHSKFGAAQSILPLPTSLSPKSVEILMINVAAPFYVAAGAILGDIETAEKGETLLRSIGAESNSMVTVWQRGGIKAASAFESQALLRLRKSYCNARRCLECRFGYKVLGCRV